MASSGKKGKKTKGKTLALNDFLQESTGVGPGLSIRKTNLNWADEVEDTNEYDPRPKANVILPTAPKSSRGLDEYSDKIPNQPPYMAYLSNLPYDVNDEEILEFFGDLKISNLRVPRDDRSGEGFRLKGFGYVEFEDREGLIGALSIADCTLKNRRIRIEVATNSDGTERRRNRMDNNRDRPDRSEITSGDWRSGPRSDPVPDSDRGSRGMGGGFNRDRDNSTQERGGSWRDSSDRPTFREGFSRDENRRGFGMRRGDRDDRDFSRGGNRDEQRLEPRTRPKLNLIPRTKPIENAAPESNKASNSNQEQLTEPQPNLVPTGATASIFGDAKPVDTAARERQIEDKLAREKVDVPANKDFRRRDDWSRRDSPPRRNSPPPRRYPSRRNSPSNRRENSRDRDSRRGSLERNGSPTRHTPPPLNRSPSPEDGRPISPASNGKSYSPERNQSPERSPPRRRDSPPRRRDSPIRRRDFSPRRRDSPPRRRDSPPRRRDSSPRRRDSPPRRRDSPPRRRDSPPRRRDSPPRRRDSPIRRRDSPSRRRNSPPRRRDSPPRRRNSPIRRRDSPPRRNDSPPPNKKDSSQERGDSPTRDNDSPTGYRSNSPSYRKDSPTRKWGSLERKISPDRANSIKGLGRKNADDRDKKAAPPPKADKYPKTEKDKPKDKSRENHEREMPKLKEAKPPNFVASNKYAHLKAEDDSD